MMSQSLLPAESDLGELLHPGGLFPVEQSAVKIGNLELPLFVGEFWTSRQRQGSSIHEISYRACFKPQLPQFLIKRFTRQGDVVYDPFSGRGTTVIEAGLMNRRIIANDVNPLSTILSAPRFCPPGLSQLSDRLDAIPKDLRIRSDVDLGMFYHRDTLREILSLRHYLQERKTSGSEDQLDRWIRMVATNRLTGHSPGFFSVYTLPPNQAVTPDRQRIINRRLKQKPPYWDTKAIILRKSKQLLGSLTDSEKAHLLTAGASARFLTSPADRTEEIGSGSIQLTVTSPPFLNIVAYAGDNWLRCWFNHLDADVIGRSITMARSVEEWSSAMGKVFRELFRITRPRGWVAFEVGEVRKKSIRLEEHVVPIGANAGFRPIAILINSQRFTKTSNIWGIDNNRSGTNTNRIVLFQKP